MKTKIKETYEKNKLNNNQKGLTLLEVALAMLVFGLIITPLIMIYNINYAQQQLNVSRGNLNHVRDNVNMFVVSNNRYPKPAPLNLGPNDIGYGEEFTFPAGCINDVSTCAADLVCPSNIASEGPPTNGVCITDTPGDPVLIGAVPFNALKIDQSRTLDAWSNKIIYAVSALQTEVATYEDTGNGAIQLQGINPAVTPLTVVPLAIFTNMDMVLVSTGPNGIGGYTAEGALIGECVDPVNPTHEDQNCNFSNTFLVEINPEFTPEASSRTFVEGEAFYDDLTIEQLNVPVQIWSQNRITPEVVISAASRIGVQEPSPDTTLHVRGDVAAERIESDQICNESGVCFDPFIIAGTAGNDTMHCAGTGLDGLPGVPAMQPVVEIGNQRVFCAVPLNSALQPLIDQRDFANNRRGALVFPPVASGLPTILNRTCGAGQLVSGIDASGDPICTATTP
ncbi:MAG: type II secretion system protein [Alphaproteobacteria bacterium]